MAGNKPQLGAETQYPERYDPQLLVSIPRAPAREKLNIATAMYGVDVWTAYEISWLNPGGKPSVAIAEFVVPCDSAAIVESKSFKLYLNSLNQECFDNREQVLQTLAKDLAVGFGCPVQVLLYSLDEYASKGLQPFRGDCLDDLPVVCDSYDAEPSLLAVLDEPPVSETLYSHLLKSNCPVTGQPDWASVQISYTGKPIVKEGLLRYLVSFRQHQDFHENCVETLFAAILERCRPQDLSVYARYTRRGGLDINPYRSTTQQLPPFCRISRQ
ncbi:MAG: NADPH-dependent 7-cyano-7-deazaguanine reductase QueF [Porticoccaceae bacterium]|nr:NADPH-dependent 7-cyano-7-deazaguanine reductase QueF [Porticoccaceae bacterium]